MEPETTNTTDTTLDAFDLAFDAASAGTAPDPPAEEPAATPEAESPQTPAVGEPPAPKAEEPKVEEPKPKAETPKPKAETPKPKAEEPPAPTAAEIEAARQAEEKQRLDAEAAAAQALARESLTEEEQAMLSQIETDFPEVHKAFEVYKRVVTAKMENRFEARLKETVANVMQQFAPVASEVQASSAARHKAEILAAHPDAYESVGALSEWIGTQPAFLQTTYNQVINNGSSKEVIELLNIFKGTTAAEKKPEPPPVETEEQKAAKAEQERRLAAQEGVRGRHTSGRATVDPEDFDGAFDKFAATA